MQHSTKNMICKKCQDKGWVSLPNNNDPNLQIKCGCQNPKTQFSNTAVAIIMSGMILQGIARVEAMKRIQKNKKKK